MAEVGQTLGPRTYLLREEADVVLEHDRHEAVADGAVGARLSKVEVLVEAEGVHHDDADLLVEVIVGVRDAVVGGGDLGISSLLGDGAPTSEGRELLRGLIVDKGLGQVDGRDARVGEDVHDDSGKEVGKQGPYRIRTYITYLFSRRSTIELTVLQPSPEEMKIHYFIRCIWKEGYISVRAVAGCSSG